MNCVAMGAMPASSASSDLAVSNHVGGPTAAATRAAPPGPGSTGDWRAAPHGQSGVVTLLLNVGHAIDHMFLLVFATAVAVMAADFGFSRWEDLMPWGVGAFVMFGLGSLPAGRLGDLWGRRPMMILFYFGMGVSLILVALTRSPWQLALALTLMGSFSAIYHPVGIPMLLQNAAKPGATIGLNGLSGNLGIAVAALITGYLVKHFGWRTAFVVPGILSLAVGLLFMWLSPRELESPSKRGDKAPVALNKTQLARAFTVMTAAAASGGLLFNLSA